MESLAPLESLNDPRTNNIEVSDALWKDWGIKYDVVNYWITMTIFIKILFSAYINYIYSLKIQYILNFHKIIVIKIWS
jgi:hypothetical protein